MSQYSIQGRSILTMNETNYDEKISFTILYFLKHKNQSPTILSFLQTMNKIKRIHSPYPFDSLDRHIPYNQHILHN